MGYDVLMCFTQATVKGVQGCLVEGDDQSDVKTSMKRQVFRTIHQQRA
jgi:hypothetical protein